MQGLAFAARDEVPRRNVDASHHLRNGAYLECLQHQHFKGSGEFQVKIFRAVKALADEALAQVHGQPRPVLCAHGRPVGPHLAPALIAVDIGQPDQDEGAVAKRTERHLDRCLHGNAEGKRLDAGDL